MKSIYILFCIFATLGSPLALAYSSRYSSSYSSMDSTRSGSIGAGLLNYDSGIAATQASSGQKPFSSQLFTQLSLTGMFPVYNEWAVSPALVYGFPNKKSTEGKETKSVDALGLRAYYLLGSGLDLHLGPGVIYYQIKGSGGTVTLNNGAGTSNFGIPSETRTSTLLYWDLGSGYKFDIYKIEASVLMTGILNSKKRAMSEVITFSVEVL